MEDTSFLAPLLLTIGGLVIGALLKSLLRHTRIPYTVGLFAVGLLVGLLNRYGIFNFWSDLSEGVNSVANINPDLILYLFLPILIFDAAYELNLHIFKKTLANATLLAVPGLIICMLLTGTLLIGIAHIVPGFESWTWGLALMFGALISATDPVAVVALLHELKTSKRFSTLVDAESLLNDGTGIVCFMLFFGTYAATGGSSSSPVMEFIQVVSISTLLGFLLARLVIWFITRINSEEMIQNSAVILSAYLTFIVSQYYLGVSGVIALLVFGLTVTYVGKPRLKPQVNNFMEHFWELLTYIANTLIFILVGIVIAQKVNFTWGALGILILIYICLNLFRFAMIMLLYPLMKRMGNSEKYLERLEKRDALEGTNWEKVRHYIFPKPQEVTHTAGTHAMLTEVRLRVLDREKALCHQLYDEGIISQSTFRRLMNSLDELYDHDGTYPLDNRLSIFRFCNRTALLNSLRKEPYLHNLMSFYFRKRIALIYDLGRGFIILQKEDLKFLDELKNSDLLNEQSIVNTLKEEINQNIKAMSELIDSLAINFPRAYKHALTLKSIRMLLSNERRTIKQMESNGVISEKDAEGLLEKVDERTDELNTFRYTIPGTILRRLFRKSSKEL